MERTRPISWRSSLAQPFVALILALMVLLPADAAHAAARLEIPEESPGGPFYARLGGPGVAPHTDEWAAIVFYRDPSCIPSDFNLLNFFDAPPRPFRCVLTVEGFEVWRNGPGQDPAPMQSKLREAGAVPVWFVSWPVLHAAATDGVLTITELVSLPTLVRGYADQFSETLHPYQGSRNGHHEMNASGTLADGRSFRIHLTAVNNPGTGKVSETKRVAIEVGVP